MWRSTISFINAKVVTSAGIAASVRFSGNVLSVNESPRRHDVIVDLDGAYVLPGLINAHDHLELNHYGRLKFQDRYDNVAHWIDDMRPRLHDDPAIRAGQAHRLAQRLFIGGLKNLLSGVTTVAHHNPVYREIGRFCPVRVVREFGWAHSYLLEDQPVGARGELGGHVATRHRATPTAHPFVMHLAEGVDDAARAELDLFATQGCLTSNAAIVHGVGITPDQWERVADTGAGFVWCPASNLYLLGRTPDVRPLLSHPNLRSRMALGSDSRISGARDLLDELKIARDTASLTPDEALHLVTTGPAELLKLKSAGQIATGRPADLTVLPNHAASAGVALLNASRKDVKLVMVAGRPLVGDPQFAQVFRERK
ncbi:MAG: amidohydrolase family protein, partial [Acidobacteria bacterium]|nr:amidohydrolase family protein [Acidobacteriota bacterium]